LKVIHRAISTLLIKQAGLKKKEASTDAVTLIHGFGSAANLNTHLYCLFLDGVYRRVDGKLLFQVVPPPSEDQLQKLLHQIM